MINPELAAVARELLLDRPPTSAERTSLHESGHCVAAHVLGIGYSTVSVIPDATTLGRLSGHKERGVRLQDLCLLSLAGPAADVHFAGGSSGWVPDLATAWLTSLELDPPRTIVELFGEARQLVERNEREIRVVAAVLDELGELSAAEVEALVAVARAGPGRAEKARREDRSHFHSPASGGDRGRRCTLVIPELTRE